MNFDFLNILALLTIFSGVVALVDIIVLAWHRRRTGEVIKEQKRPFLIDYARAFFPVLLLVLIIRSFVAQPYRVPSGSLEPTVLPGDFILVTQYNYGLKIPLWDAMVVKTSVPQRGQIGLFQWPVNTDVTFVKRVIGVPGDHISYINKVLYVNGRECTQTFVKNTLEIAEAGQTFKAKEYQENLLGIKHNILVREDRKATDFKNLVVPKGKYLMMGDNRDDSDDSRDWGFVPEHNFVGKAQFVWLSWDSASHSVRWRRIGNRL